MHNAAFAEAGLDWCYIPLPVAPEMTERIGEALRGLRALGLRGCNVTVPHKQNVMPHLDQLSQAAEAIGAVNTIIVQEDDSLLGDNTDAPGFVRDIRSFGVDLSDRRVIVLGAGGSARAIVYGLADAGAEAVMIANRTVGKAESLANDMQPFFEDCVISAHAAPDDLMSLSMQADLIINCTSVGMSPNVDGMPWNEDIAFRPDQIVYDLIYNPPETRLVQKAIADGAQAQSGLGMLVWQGVIAWELWTGETAPVEVMSDAVYRAFGRTK